MRVLLINPPPHQRVDQFDEPDFTRLGLACLAGELRARTDAAVAIIDAKFERLSYEGLRDRIRAFRPDLVGLTAFTNEITSAARVARMVKQLSPRILTVIGGVHVSVLPEDTLRDFPEFDCGVIGEGEATFTAMVAACTGGSSLGEVPGLVVRRDGAGVRTPARSHAGDLDVFASPAWDLVPPARRYLIQTQRGCPYRCAFCVNPNGTEVRCRSVERVIAELDELLTRYHPRLLYLCDENFAFDAERTHALLDAMIAADVPRRVQWTAQTHVSFLNREIMAKMKAAGCCLCSLGIESGDPEIMARLGKRITPMHVREVRRLAAEVGLPVEILMIVGHPGETWQSAMRTINLAVELNGDSTLFGVMVPYPGTRVAELARRGEGGYRLLSHDWNDYNKQIGHALELDHLTRRQLELLQMMGYLKVLLWNGRFADLARFTWRYRREGWAVAQKLLLGRRPRPVLRSDCGSSA